MLETIGRRVAVCAALVASIVGMARAGVPVSSYDHAFNPDDPEGNKYHLDMSQDQVPLDALSYCRWGLLLDEQFALAGRISLRFSYLTLPPYSNDSSDLFVSFGAVPLSPLPSLAHQAWTSPSGPRQPGMLTFDDPAKPAVSTGYLFRKLHFSPVLQEWISPESQPRLSADAQKLVIMVHGWNRDQEYDAYIADQFLALATAIRAQISSHPEWRLVGYHWEADADTGPLLDVQNTTRDWAPLNGAEAAEIAHLHGLHLGQVLLNNFPRLQSVQFIAHSAGSWCARAAAKYLLQRSPQIAVQVTLLDPFVPGEVSIGEVSIVGQTSLTVSRMNELLDAGHAPFLLENYFSTDLATKLGTESTFSWRPFDIPHQSVNWSHFANTSPPSDVSYYDSHSGPVQFYADSVDATDPEKPYPVALIGAPYQADLPQLGWSRSLFMNEIVCLALRGQPTAIITGVSGQSLSLQADAIARRNQLGSSATPIPPKYRWLKINKASNTRVEISPPSYFNTCTFPNLGASDEGDYLVEADNGTGPVSTPFSVKLVSANPAFTLTMSGAAAGSALEIQVSANSTTFPVLLMDPVGHSYTPGTLVTLTAPATAPNGAVFARWLVDGLAVQTSRSLAVTMDRSHSAVAVYQSAGGAPVVAILQPSPDLVVTEPSLVSITASAIAVSPATLAHVRFYIDGVLVKTDTTAPYSYEGVFLAQDNGPRKLAVIATDSLGRTSERMERTVSVAIDVAGAPSLPTVLELPTATAGVSYAASLSAAGGVIPYAWSIASGGSLPPGLILSGDVLSGTPTTPGTYTVRLRVTGANSLYSEGSFVLAIAPSAIVAPPQFAPGPGAFDSPVTVTAASATPDALIRYTTDGSDPTASSTGFPVWLPVSQSLVLKARAFKAGYQPSAITTATYTIAYGQTTAKPVIDPPAGTYTDPVTIFMSSATAFAQIYYTLDGTPPLPEVSPRYNGQFTLYGPATVSAIAVAPSANPSTIATAAYHVSTSANNDAFANRHPLQGANGQSTGSNLTATKEAGEPVIFLQDRGEAYNPGGRSIWWAWRAPYSGKVTFDTIGSEFNSLLGVYVGTSVDELTFVAGDDASGDHYSTSKVTFDAVQGREYEIVVDGLADRVNGDWTPVALTGSGHIRLNWQMLDPAPEPDTTTDYRWVVRGGGTGQDVGQGVCIDPVGNVYTTGFFTGTATFGDTTLVAVGGYDVFVAKYTPDGRLLWVRAAGGPGTDQGFGLAAGLDGRVYVLGVSGGTAAFAGAAGALPLASAGLFVACFAGDGTAQWVRGYGDSTTKAHRIVVDGTGHPAVAGVFEGSGDFGGITLTSAGKTDLFLMKLSPAGGAAFWAKRAGGTNFDETYGLAVDPQNRFYIAGDTRSFTTVFDSVTIARNTGLENAFVACYDADGAVQWARTYSSQGDNYAKAVTVDGSGNVYAAGVYNGTASFGSSTLANRSADFFVIKTDASGNLIWTREFGSPTGNDGGFFGLDFKDIGLGVDERGNIAVSGLYSGTVTVGVNQITAQGGVDILTAKITPSGDFIWLKTAGTPNPNAAWPSDIIVSSTGVVYQTGRFMATTTFSSQSAVSSGDKDYFLARLSGPVNRMPQVPVNAQPADGAQVATTGLVLRATAFADPDSGDSHDASQWLIRRSDNTVVFDSGPDATNKLAEPVGAALEAGATYRWQVRYRDSAGTWSDYSAPTAFTITAGRLPQSIQFSAIGPHTFGDPDFEVTATASSGLPTVIEVRSGAARIAGTRITLLGASQVTLRASQPGNDTYEAAAPVETTFVTEERAATVILSDLAQTYASALRTVGARVDGMPEVPIIVTYDGALSPPVAAGSYSVLAVIEDPNFRGSSTGTLVVAKAPLTVRADDKSRATGSANPALTISYSGLVGGDSSTAIDLPPSISTAATAGSPAGHYTIVLSGGSDDNYALILRNGTLTVTGIPPTNDDFVQSAILAGASGEVSLTLVDATREAMDPEPVGLDLTNSVWYRWTAPTSGEVTFRLSGYGFSPFVAVYTGASPETLTALASNTVSGFVTFNAIAGTTYTMLIDRWAGMPGTSLLSWLYGAPPVITTEPADQTVPAGENVTFTVVATATPTPSYQWFKDGATMPAATSSTLTLDNVQPAAAAAYTVVLTNAAGSTTSHAARLGVLSPGTSAHHAVAVNGYTTGGTLIVTNTFAYTGQASDLVWQALIPEGWVLAEIGGMAADVQPAPGDTGGLVWRWNTIPSSPLVFTYTLNVPAGTAGTRMIAAVAQLGQGTGLAQLLVRPDPLRLANLAEPHSADTTAPRGQISLVELLRVIELYNVREGTVRSGRYHPSSGTEDGFAAGASDTPGTFARYHSGDVDQDGRISLVELLRVIELYNYRAGTVRTGQYHLASGTEDGFAPGP